jgi:hypothetical protein
MRTLDLLYKRVRWFTATIFFNCSFINKLLFKLNVVTNQEREPPKGKVMTTQQEMAHTLEPASAGLAIPQSNKHSTRQMTPTLQYPFKALV